MWVQLIDSIFLVFVLSLVSLIWQVRWWLGGTAVDHSNSSCLLLNLLVACGVACPLSAVEQWLQSLAHPHDRLLDVSTWVVVAFCAVSLYSLIVLAWKDGTSWVCGLS